MTGGRPNGITVNPDRPAGSRRRFLRRLFVLLTAPFAVRCAGSSGTSNAEVEAQAATYDRDLVCDDTKGLWPAEAKTRTDNDYNDTSNQPGKYCFNCTNYQPPETPGTCATCRTVKGPIHPLGYCNAWTEK